MKTINDYAELVKAEHALNKTIAPVEDGANIAGSYTSGKQFIRHGVLYTALTTIAANTAWSSLTLDTDYEVADDLTTQLASVNQALTNEIDNIKIVEITVTSDGVKTFSDLLKELVNNAKSYVSGTDLKLAPYALAIPAVAFMPIAANKQISKSSSSETLVGNGMAWAGGTFLLYYVEFEANAAIFYNCSLGTTPSIAFNNKASDIPATGFKFVLSCIQTN